MKQRDVANEIKTRNRDIILENKANDVVAKYGRGEDILRAVNN